VTNVDLVDSTDADLLLTKFEERIAGDSSSTTGPKFDHVQCKKQAECEKLYMEYANTDSYFLCLKTCSETLTLNTPAITTYRYGHGVSGVQEHCVKTCPATRDHSFTNTEGDTECTSDCPPLPAESIQHGDATSVANIAAKIFTFATGYNYSGTVIKTCMSDCTIANDPNLHNVSENQCLY
jgi:hypothetical protein